MTMRKGQLSVMIILGLVVMIVVGLGWFILSSGEEARSRVVTTKTEVSRDLVGTVEQFVAGCLRVAATSSLDLVGKQGGVLYRGQGGLTPDSEAQELGFKVIMHDNIPVKYGLYAPAGQVASLHYSTPPLYPWPTFPDVYGGSLPPRQRFTGFFGVEAMPEIDGASDRTIRKQLESGVAHGVDNCLDWGKLAHLPITIRSSPAKIAATLAPDDVTFVLDAAVMITLKDGSGESTLKLATLNLPVRLKKLYETVNMVLDKDATDSQFDVASFGGDDMSVTVARDVPRPDGKVGDDVLLFVDQKSVLEGRPYQFRTARQNRYPALLFDMPIIPPATTPVVPLTKTNLCFGAKITRTGGVDDHLEFNTIVCEDGDSLNERVPASSPLGTPPISYFGAVDPDEDALHVEIVVNGLNLADAMSFTTVATSFAPVEVEVRAIEDNNPLHVDVHNFVIPATRAVATAAEETIEEAPE